MVSLITGAKPPFVYGTSFDLADVGYVQAEYRVGGRARAYRRAAGGVAVAEEADFATRMLVYRPAGDAAFSGTLWVEWLNVSAGFDAAPAWTGAHTELIRSGAAWVGVSAQRVGVTGGMSLLGIEGPGLVATDAERYDGLQHPGDRFSYDIFAQASAAARAGAGTILDGLPIRRVLAVGESQSAFRLTTFINDVDPLAAVHDGFLVLARPGAAAPLDRDGSAERGIDGPPVLFRDDTRVPVLCVESETDLITLGYLAARQDDGHSFVLWEVAGTAHADLYTLTIGSSDSGLLPLQDLARAWIASNTVVGIMLDKPVNAGQRHYVLCAAVAGLDRWVRDGARPPAAPRLEVSAGRFVTDEHGNVRGGVRTPVVDIPVAALSGLGNTGPFFAFLAGTTTPFEPGEVRELYPARDDYLSRYQAAAAAAAESGFLAADDVAEITAIAAANFPG